MAERKKKRVPASLKRVRKAVPKPTKVEASKKTYRRKGKKVSREDDFPEEVGC